VARAAARIGRTGCTLVVLALLLHVAIALSIIAQPLDVNAAPPWRRSAVWGLFSDAVHRKGPGADFFAVYHAGVQVSRGASPYDPREDPPRTPYYYAFRYLPGVAVVLGLPLARLAPRMAYCVWLGVLESLLAVLIVLLWRRGPAPWISVFAALALLLSTPYFLELHMGQFTFAAVALLAMALLAVGRDPPAGAPAAWGASWLFAAAALLKVFPLVSLPALLRRRAGVLCAAVAAFVLLGCDLPAFMGRPGLFRAFADANFVRPVSGLDSGNHGLFYLIYMAGRDLGVAWAPERWHALARAWQIALLAPTVGLVSLTRHPARVTLGGALLVVAHLLTYVHVWEHHASGAILVGLIMLMDLARADGGSTVRRGASLSVWLAAAAVVLLALPTPFALFDRTLDVSVLDPSAGWPQTARYLMPACKVVPLVTLFVLGWRALLKPGPSAPASS
jgi:hypothetical protein